MDRTKSQNSQKNRFLKLSLKKNRRKEDESKKANRSSDVILLEESFDRLKSDFPRKLNGTPKIYSPIVIDDSCELSDDSLPNMVLKDIEPSRFGNVSFNKSIEEKSPECTKESRPSTGGWSSAQSIICARPRYETVPSTPRDIANESHEECSLKKIQQSQKKLLSDLYGETWKSIPKLFKTITQNYENFDGVSKKLQFDDDEDKENIRHDLQRNKELYLTGSDAKKKFGNFCESEKKSKKKLYTEKVPSTPDVPKPKTVRTRNVNSTTKKAKAMSVTELVEIMKKDVNELAKKVENVSVTPSNDVKRLSFVGSLADNVPTWRCHPEAFQYRDNYKQLREQLTRRLYAEFNKEVFGSELEEDMPVIWDSKLRSTAGTTTNRLLKNSKGERRRTSSIKLSTKVVDGPQRLRDTLIHELCHAATWLIDGELRAGHGPLWKKWWRDIKLSTKVVEIKLSSKVAAIKLSTKVAAIKLSTKVVDIKVSTKVVDGPQRLQDTLIHELCHAATWLIDGELRAGHGPLWKKWATHALRKYPELGEISRCHDMQIHFKYSYKCTKCGYSIQRHSKSIDTTKKCCGYCRGTFEVILNKKTKDGVVVSTPARKGEVSEFAKYVKDNYGSFKTGRTHAEVMKVLGEQFSAKKKGPL